MPPFPPQSTVLYRGSRVNVAPNPVMVSLRHVVPRGIGRQERVWSVAWVVGVAVLAAETNRRSRSPSSPKGIQALPSNQQDSHVTLCRANTEAMQRRASV